jgi:hypothetical protein
MPLGPVPLLGPLPSTAPDAFATVAGEAAQALGPQGQLQQLQISGERQRQQLATEEMKYREQMLNMEMQNQQFTLGNQRLTALNAIISQNPKLSSNPDIVSAFQRAYQSIGVPPPLTTDATGKPTIDLAAAGAYAPLQATIAKDWPTLQLMNPDDRLTLLQAEGYSDIPDSIKAAVTKIPRKILSGKDEASALVGRVFTAVRSLNSGGSIGNVIAEISLVKPALDEAFSTGSGPSPTDTLIENLKPDLEVQTRMRLQNELLVAKTEKARADIQNELTLLPAKIAQINSLDSLRAAMTPYYEAKTGEVGAMTSYFGAKTQETLTLMGPKAGQLRAQTTRDLAEADKFHHDVQDSNGKSAFALKYGVKEPTGILNLLQRNKHEAAVHLDNLQKAKQQAMTNAQALGGTPDDVKAAGAPYDDAITTATKDAKDTADTYNQAFRDAQTPSGANPKLGNQPAGGPAPGSKGKRSAADVIRVGAKNGLTPEQAIQDAEKHGYSVVP